MEDNLIKNMNAFDSIVNVAKNDLNNENANMNSATPAGQMMKFASEIAKDYTHQILLNSEYSKLHKEGWIHIHDLDFYPTKSTTCLQYDLEDLFKNGFYTTKGFIREPQSIKSYVDLALLVFQGNQNEQHGGQAIPAFDFMMAPGVCKSFAKLTFKENWKQIFHKYETIEKMIEFCHEVAVEYKEALECVKKETFQAMESFIYNLNTIHSRGGNQVVFSSINYGTDWSIAGQIVIDSILEATIKGLGHGETPIFPIQIFKVKEGVNYNVGDNNYFLFKKAIKTNSTRLFPNFMFLDTEFNKHEKWDYDDPKRWKYETATMGCRTRVFENVCGEKSSIGRGNLSFTSINLPRLALESKNIIEFYEGVKNMSEKVANQLLDRYKWQKSALKKQFPFMNENDLWKGAKSLGINEKLGEVLDQGTLSIGFIGGHEAMIVLNGEGHGINEKSQKILLNTIQIIRNVCDEFKNKYNLNFSCLGTPAEGLSGRFVAIDREKYGEIKDVTDKSYYTNSFHVWVGECISPMQKIRVEAPFHKICNAGHISYVEFDGEAKSNPKALEQVVRYMKENQIGYGSINHPVDRCRDCNQTGVFEIECSVCHSTNISRIRRITGYLVGDMDSWNSGKINEEKDRIKHTKYTS